MKWISVEERMPDVIWTDHDDGKKYFSPQIVLVQAVLHLNDGSKLPTICMAEYDNTCFPEEWKTVLDFFDPEAPYNGLDFHSVVLQEVTHWMSLPKLPENCIDKKRTK